MELFYGIYNIDPSEIGCGKVITVDCDNLHHYVNLCDLIEECVSTLPHDITKECIRNFFNTTIDTLPAGYFLRIDAQHCIEAVDITTLLQCSDIYVKVNSNDATSGYLASKFGSRTDGCLSTVVVPTGPANHPILQVQVTYPDSPFLCGLPALPACDNAIVTIDSEGNIAYNCDDIQNRYWATLYTNADIVINSPVNVYKSYIFSNSTWTYNAQVLATAGSLPVAYGEPSMINSPVSSIVIPKDGMYEVWFKGEAVINNGVSRARLFILSTNDPKKILIDSKFGGETGVGGSISPLCHDIVTEMTYTFTGSGLVKLNAGDVIGLGCKIDSRNTGGITPQVTRRASVYDLGDGTQPEVATSGPGLSFGCKRYSSITHGAI